MMYGFSMMHGFLYFPPAKIHMAKKEDKKEDKKEELPVMPKSHMVLLRKLFLSQPPENRVNPRRLN